MIVRDNPQRGYSNSGWREYPKMDMTDVLQFGDTSGITGGSTVWLPGGHILIQIGSKFGIDVDCTYIIQYIYSH
jgi:hypothetical protein